MRMEPLASMVARLVKFYIRRRVSILKESRIGKGTYLGSNELETRVLTPCLLVNDVLDLGVDLGEGGVEALVLRVSSNVSTRSLAESFPERV